MVSLQAPNQHKQINTIFLNFNLTTHEKPAEPPHISESSAPPRPERTARQPRAPPPARAIYFRMCLRC
jgi:hypothetical protein